MPLVAHPVRSLWGSQPRCARCVCEWLHRKRDGAGADVNGRNERGDTAMYLALYNENFYCVALLAAGGAKDVTTPLYYAIQAGKYECVKELIKAGANVNTRHNGRTVLEHALKAGDHECMKSRSRQIWIQIDN